MTALLLAVLLALGQNPQELYQRGLAQEQASGNLKEAIKLYSQVIQSAGKDRALAAKALVRIAGAHEKLGQQAEATAAYTDVLQKYPDQRDQVALAQEHLGTKSNLQDVSAVTGPLFQNYCVTCHNGTKKSGGLDLGTLNAKDVGENTTIWETVLRRLQARRDPPSQPRPDDKTYVAVISKLSMALDSTYPTNKTADRVTDTELATRIATFLWGTAPDASLLEDARNGKLNGPTLERQIARMLKDPKSSHLVSDFFEPWLSLNRLKPGPQLDVDLVQSMQTETRLFLESQVRLDRDALELWTANYTFVNERLARHYGMSGISGKDFRSAQWPDSKRAGILGQAGPLAVLSSGGRTSPVMRGIFVMRQFLGLDPSAPPPNVPPLPEPDNDRPGSLRERMEAHARNPVCANCHSGIDVYGFALENFDAIGQWRTSDSGFAINASGTFPDGTRFNGPAELRAGLLKYRDAYYSNVTKQLLAYALNRKLEGRVYDYEMPSVRAIVQAASVKDYRWSSIINGIVSSAPFQMKNLVP
jgi:hypothetical protein